MFGGQLEGAATAKAREVTPEKAEFHPLERHHFCWGYSLTDLDLSEGHHDTGEESADSGG